MISGMNDRRLLNMTDQEKRWFDNTKKAIYESDQSIVDDRPEDRCLEELFKGIDTAKTLRRSLRDESGSHNENNKKRFIEFLSLEIPCAAPGSQGFPLIESETGGLKEFTLGQIAYAVRCKIHENENLNADEGPDYHVLIDWSDQARCSFGALENGRLLISGWFLAGRIREVLSKFMTGIQFTIDIAEGRSAKIDSRPPLGSIKHDRVAGPAVKTRSTMQELEAAGGPCHGRKYLVPSNVLEFAVPCNIELLDAEGNVFDGNTAEGIEAYPRVKQAMENPKYAIYQVSRRDDNTEFLEFDRLWDRFQ